MRNLRRASTRTLLASVLLLCAATLPAHAQWQWKDRSGNVTASDLPPPRDVPDKDILRRPTAVVRSQPGAATAAAPASTANAASAAPAPKPADRELEARKRAADQEQAAKTRAEEERVASQRADNCRRARSHLSALESGQRIARVNDKGEREVLDDKGRADETRQAREVITSDCK